MAYPFGVALPFAQFKKLLIEKFACEHKQLENRLFDSEGTSEPISYFERTHEGKTYTATCQNFDDDEIITFSIIRSVCARLGIDPRELGIGLDLG